TTFFANLSAPVLSPLARPNNSLSQLFIYWLICFLLSTFGQVCKLGTAHLTFFICHLVGGEAL
ncbi:MAG: hypothetical protein ACREBG_01800, partial [Pyrinomonadaceae bacterium]